MTDPALPPPRPAGVSATSGSQWPTPGRAIAMAHPPPSDALPGTMLQVSAREVGADAEVVALPFYWRRG